MAYEPGAPHSIKIIDTEICSAKLKAEHPEPFHYTGRGGFEPIVKPRTSGIVSAFCGDNLS